VGVPKNVAIPAANEVMPVPPLATGSVPVTPVVSGRPVQLVNTPLEGVPNAGVTRVGLVLFALVAIAVAMLSNSVSNSLPLITFEGLPGERESLGVKEVVLV
jgi:hypothetical protein